MSRRERGAYVAIVALLIPLGIWLTVLVTDAVEKCENDGGEWITRSIKPYIAECEYP